MVTTGDGSPSNFAIALSFDGFEAIVAVRGEVDKVTALEMGDFLDEAIDQGRRFVVLDLAELDFIDVSGLWVIAERADRLALSGGALTIRSPSATVRRLLDTEGLADLVRLEKSKLSPDRLAPGKCVNSSGDSV
jgi:anti-anti-sigma factor